MDNLKQCIDYHNHFTTISIRDSYVLRYKNTPLEHPDFENSISLYDFLYSFGNMYRSFKEELDKLPKFSLGESFEVWDYLEYANEKEATLYINNPTIVDNDFCYLNMVKNNDTNEIDCYTSIVDHEYYLKNNKLDLDIEFAKSYFDFISKYVHFIECYNVSNGNIMVSWQHCQITNKYDGDLYKKVNNVSLRILMDYHEYFYEADVIFDLDTLSVDYDKSAVKINDVKVDKKEVIDTMLSDIYVNKGRIAPVYSDTEEDKVLRLKKGLDI